MAMFVIAAAAVVVGALISRPRKQAPQPSLEDLKVGTSSYGTAIPIIEGHPRVPSICVWASDKRAIATTTEVGGKGGGGAKQTTYTYEVDLLLLVSANQIAGVGRAWKDGKLIFNQLSSATGASVIASGTTEHWGDMIFYTGGPAQLPDPTYEAALGVGNVPAFRDCGTVMLKSLNLGSGGSLPNLTFELASAGSIGAVPSTLHDFTSVANYLVVASADVVDYSGISADETGFAPGQAPYGNAPHPTSPLSGIAPNTAIPTLSKVWVRKTLSVVAGLAATITIYHDDLAALWADGASITLTPGATFTSTATFTPATSTLVIALRVTDTVPGAPIYTYAAFRLVQNLGALTMVDVALQDVVSRLCLRAGLVGGDIDVTGLAGPNVRGMAISQVTSARQVIETLMRAHHFEGVEAQKLRFVFRGGASVASIPYDSLGASTGQSTEPLPIKLRNDIELPAYVSVRYSNADNDYQEGSELSDRLVTESNAVELVELPLVLTATEAKRIADVAAMDLAVAKTAIGPLSLSRAYSHIEPTDVVTATDFDGSTFRLRLARKTESDGVLSFEAVLDDASVLSSAAATDTGYTPSSTVAAPADTVLELLDMPILRDADDGAGFYVAAHGSADPWPGAAIYSSRDNIDYTQRTTVTESAVTGAATSTLANWGGGNVFDEINRLTVSVAGGSLASTTRDNLLDAGANAALVGSEIIQFRDAALIGPGLYALSGLLRGRRGTEWAMSGHAASERFVLLRTTGLRRLEVQTDEIGQLRYLRGVTLGRKLATAASKLITPAAKGLLPFAPVELRNVSAANTPAALRVLFNGADGSTTFTDLASPAHTLTANGNARIRTADGKFGGSALFSDGTGDFVSFPTSSALDFGSADFTIEFWLKQLVTPAASQRVIQSRNGDTFPGLYVAWLNTTTLEARFSTSGSAFTHGPINFTFATGVWKHVAITRFGATYSVWLDGVLQGTAAASGALYYNAADSWVLLGQTTPDRSSNAYLDDLRITKGIAWYTSAFTPPSSELPLPNAGTGDLDITWSRRTRLAKNFSSGLVPLGEAVEAYEVDIFSDNTFAILKRTLTGITSPSATYTAAQQTTDFSSLQTTVHVRVYQLNATVGRGYAAQGSI